MSRMTQVTLLAALTVSVSALGARADIKIGLGAPITGPNAAFGAQLQKGAEQAIADINAAGGVLGQTLVLDVGDDVSDPKQGVSVANKFAGDGVQLVVGHFNSGVTIPASEVYADNDMLDVTPAATNPKVTERGLWNVFRTCGRDDQQGLVASAFILKHFKGKRVAILQDKTTYGKGLADETKKGLNKGGLQEVMYEGINVGDKDFSALVSKIKAANVDLVYWGGLHTELGLIIRQMRDQGLATPAMGADGIVSAEFAAIGGPGVEGTFMTFPPDPRKRAIAARIVKEFTDKGFDPEAYTLYAYAAVEVIKQAAEQAKSIEPRSVAATIKSGMAFHTVLGDMTYDQKGDRTNIDYVPYVWKKVGDQITYVQIEGEGN